jgi:hypothetical protein
LNDNISWKDATGENCKTVEALDLIRADIKLLRKKGYSTLNIRHLDNLNWNYK